MPQVQKVLEKKNTYLWRKFNILLLTFFAFPSLYLFMQDYCMVTHFQGILWSVSTTIHLIPTRRPPLRQTLSTHLPTHRSRWSTPPACPAQSPAACSPVTWYRWRLLPLLPVPQQPDWACPVAAGLKLHHRRSTCQVFHQRAEACKIAISARYAAEPRCACMHDMWVDDLDSTVHHYTITMFNFLSLLFFSFCGDVFCLESIKFTLHISTVRPTF